MSQNAPSLIHEHERLIKIDRWIHRFSVLVLVSLLFSVLAFGYNLVYIFSDSRAFAGLDALDNYWFKSNWVISGLRAIAGELALYFLLQGLSKVINYLLRLKNLALNRYHTRKTSA